MELTNQEKQDLITEIAKLAYAAFSSGYSKIEYPTRTASENLVATWEAKWNLERLLQVKK